MRGPERQRALVAIRMRKVSVESAPRETHTNQVPEMPRVTVAGRAAGSRTSWRPGRRWNLEATRRSSTRVRLSRSVAGRHIPGCCWVDSSRR